MKKTVLVVSDLHLGGSEGFQMCTPAGAAQLASFFHWAGGLQRSESGVDLVLAGDVVDFLAEPDDQGQPRERWTWTPFVADEALVLAKLERILARTAEVWQELSEFVVASGTLTILLGNHDVELSLPRVRRRLLESVAPAGGRVNFLYDGEAFALGELLVEHGNRYEGWNVVAHDSLRRLRSALSRGEPAPDFPPQPGSRLVAEVMNPIKARYAFVDLLKPETSGVLPILAVLDPAIWRRAGRAIADGARAAWRQGRLGPEGPSSGEFINASMAAAASPRGSELIGSASPRQEHPAAAGLPFPDEDAISLADQLARGAKSEQISAIRDVELGLLLRAFRARRDKDESGFDVGQEAALYRKPAEALARRGYRVIVFGHTHHAKVLRFATPGGEATYLNSGTWADLMRLPPNLYQGSPEQGERTLADFLQAVGSNDIAKYRRQVPSFARIDLDQNGRAVASNVFFFQQGSEPEPLSTAGVLSRLALGDCL